MRRASCFSRWIEMVAPTPSQTLVPKCLGTHGGYKIHHHSWFQAVSASVRWRQVTRKAATSGRKTESVQHLQHYGAVLISTCGPVLAGFPQTKIPSFLPVAPSTPSDAEGPAKCVSLLSESPSPGKGAGRADAALSLPKTVG